MASSVIRSLQVLTASIASSFSVAKTLAVIPSEARADGAGFEKKARRAVSAVGFAKRTMKCKSTLQPGEARRLGVTIELLKFPSEPLARP